MKLINNTDYPFEIYKDNEENYYYLEPREDDFIELDSLDNLFFKEYLIDEIDYFYENIENGSDEDKNHWITWFFKYISKLIEFHKSELDNEDLDYYDDLSLYVSFTYVNKKEVTK